MATSLTVPFPHRSLRQNINIISRIEKHVLSTTGLAHILLFNSQHRRVLSDSKSTCPSSLQNASTELELAKGGEKGDETW